MTYTVHLPLDLGLAGPEPSLDKALRVIRKTEVLAPYGLIVHLDGKKTSEMIDGKRWLENSLESLRILSQEVEPEKLCVENLENHHPGMIDSVLEETAVSCCVDVGHLWKQGINPTPPLSKWISRTRVVHIHGVGKRDHKSLSLMPDDKLDPVVELLTKDFRGVLTFEIFNERDLVDSIEAFERSRERVPG
jgi:sugar phosphate isomerase/epimerase